MGDAELHYPTRTAADIAEPETENGQFWFGMEVWVSSSQLMGAKVANQSIEGSGQRLLDLDAAAAYGLPDALLLFSQLLMHR